MKTMLDLPAGLLDEAVRDGKRGTKTATIILALQELILREKCLRVGINEVGIPDLAIAQHADRLDIPLFSLDGHVPRGAGISELRLWPLSV